MQRGHMKTLKANKTTTATTKTTFRRKSSRKIATKARPLSTNSLALTSIPTPHHTSYTTSPPQQQRQQRHFVTNHSTHNNPGTIANALTNHYTTPHHTQTTTPFLKFQRRTFSTANDDEKTSEPAPGPVYHQQLLKAAGSVSKEDQEQMEKRMAQQKAKHQQEVETARLKKAQKSDDAAVVGSADPTSAPNDQLAADGDVEGAEANQSDDDYDAPPTPEEMFYDMAPLHSDLWHYEPRNHRSTLLWLPDHFETHNVHSHSFNLLQSKQMRVAIPTPPKRECTVVGGEEKNAWYDVHTVPFDNEKADLDFEGMKATMYQLHQFIRDEAFYLGERLALQLHNGDSDKAKAMSDTEVEKLGAERIFLGGFGQGAAAAMFAGLRYPHRLGGIMSHSGYIPYVDQTIEAATLLKKKFDEDLVTKKEEEAITTMESSPASITPTFDLSQSVPNINTPLYVVYNSNDQVIPWLGLAQPSFIKAIKEPLKCKMILRTGKSTGHSIASADLFEFQYWQNESITKLDAEFEQRVKENKQGVGSGEGEGKM